MSTIDQGVSSKTIPESCAMTYNFMCHTARDAVEQEAKIRMFKHRTVPRGPEIIEIASGLGIKGAFGTKTHIADLPGDFAKLGTIGQCGGIFQVFWKVERFIKPAQKACQAPQVDGWA